MVAWRDDGGVVGVALDGGKQAHHRSPVSLCKFALTAARQQHVIRGNAGLPCVEQLAMRNLECCVLHVAMAVDDAGRLAPQFQRGGRQVLRRRLRHLAAHRRGAREHQMIKRQRGEQGGQVGISLHHTEFVGSEELRHQQRQLGRGMGRQLAGLEHDPVARRQCRDGGRQGQLHRVVPRRNHPHHSHGLALDEGVGRLQVNGRVNLAGLDPLGQVAQCVRQQGAQHKEVGHLREAGGPHAKVGLHGRRQHRPILIEQFAKAQQSLTAHKQRHIHMRAAGLELKIEMGADIGGCHGRMIGDTPVGTSQKGMRVGVDARWLAPIPQDFHERALVAGIAQRPPPPYQRSSRASTSVTCAAPGRMPPRRDAAASSPAPSGARLRRRPADQRSVVRKTLLKPVRGSTPITHGVTGRPVSRAQPARSTHTSASNMAAARRLANKTSPMAITTTRSSRLTTPATKSFKRHLSFTIY